MGEARERAATVTTSSDGPRYGEGRRREAPWALVALGLLGLLAGGGGAARLEAQIVGQPGGPVQLDFQDLDLAYVLSALAQAAGLNLIYHDLPAKPVTLRTSQPVPRAEIPNLIRSLAAANAVAISEEGGFIRLMGGGEDPDPRRLYIHKLRHARAATLGGTLQALFGGGVAAPGGAQLRPTLSQQLQQIQAGAQATAVQTPQGVVITTAGGGAGLQGSVLIVPEEVTNSLLIRATPSDWSIVEQAVLALDLRPLQVVIEVVIAEVRHTDGLDLGVSFQGVRETAGGFGVVELPPRQGTPEDALTVRVARFGNVDVSATLSALASSGEVRILARPVVLAQNNQPARILVGTQQPFIQFSQTIPSDPAGSQFQTVQYREVGTVLNILPTINDDGYVNLAVAQEVSSATAETQFGAPVISTREAETQLLARNGQTVVIGGLVDQQVDRVRQGIPILKDIPVLGFLFGSVRDRVGSSELFLFLTPYIVATDEDADLLRERIETEREMIAPFLPVEPITPPVAPPAPPSGAPAAPPVDPAAPAPPAADPAAPPPPPPPGDAR